MNVPPATGGRGVATAIGSYRLARQLWRSDLRTAWAAQPARGGAEVELVLLTPPGSQPPGARRPGLDRLQRSIAAAAEVRHPGVLPVLDVGLESDQLFFTTPLGRGEPLSVRLARSGSLPVELAIETAAEVCDALQVAHSRGVLHGGLAADTVRLRDGGGVLLAELGLGALLSQWWADLTRSRRPEAMPSSLPPEFLRGEPATVQTDVYGLGALLHQMLTGRPPGDPGLPERSRFEALSLAGVQRAIAAGCRAVVERCLAGQPADRFGGLADVRRELAMLREVAGSLETGEATASRPPEVAAAEAAGRTSHGDSMAVTALPTVAEEGSTARLGRARAAAGVPQPGEMFLDKYRIRREVGRGAMGVVFEAEDSFIGRRVAVKTLQLDEAGTAERRQELLARLAREARAAGRLIHPNIVLVFEAGVARGTGYIVMEFVEGRTLQALLRDAGRLERHRAGRIVIQIAEALGHAHQQQIVHRDVKPANVMLAADERVKVADFGIAKVLTEASRLTRDDVIVGTPTYLSPEQIWARPLDGRSDLFSLAIIFYQCLTGRPPFEANTLAGLLQQITTAEPERLGGAGAAGAAELPGAYQEFFDRALAKQRENRYSDARSFAEAVEAVGRASTPAVRSSAPRPERADPTSAPRGQDTVFVPGWIEGRAGEAGGDGASLPPPAGAREEEGPHRVALARRAIEGLCRRWRWVGLLLAAAGLLALGVLAGRALRSRAPAAIEHTGAVSGRDAQTARRASVGGHSPARRRGIAPAASVTATSVARVAATGALWKGNPASEPTTPAATPAPAARTNTRSLSGSAGDRAAFQAVRKNRAVAHMPSANPSGPSSASNCSGSLWAWCSRS